ncbi:MAG: hypothetical protein J6Y98_09725 [Bacteroidales bacterium]|nr:hypothetical protein [Bacteroidales bacterium]
MKNIIVTLLKAVFIIAIIIIGYYIYDDYSTGKKEEEKKQKIADYSEEIISHSQKGNYVGAHNMLNELRVFIGESNEDYYNALEGLYRDEIKDIVNNQPESAIKKIPLLLSEIPVEGKESKYYSEYEPYNKYVEAYNKMCRYTLELAVNTDDINLAKKMLESFKCTVKTDDNNELQRDCSEKESAVDYCAAHFNINAAQYKKQQSQPKKVSTPKESSAKSGGKTYNPDQYVNKSSNSNNSDIEKEMMEYNKIIAREMAKSKK